MMENMLRESERQRFEARSMVTPSIIRDEPNPDLETMIFSTAANFPYMNYNFPTISTFTPNSSVMLYIAQYMDYLMSSTKHWTHNCMGWAPPYTQIYLSLLFYIQTIRAMKSAAALSIASDLNSLLTNFLNNYPLENILIPGPLVQFFKNLSYFTPSNQQFGNVTPTLPNTPGWKRENRYTFTSPFHLYLPNISLLISRLRSVCSIALQNGMTPNLFGNHVDGPRFCATLFSQPCVHDANEQRNMISPGASFVLSGDLTLWRNAAIMLDYNGFPDDLDVDVDDVNDDWSSALRMDTIHEWFDPLVAMMTKYCQFWKGSTPLSDCAPNCFASAGGVKCRVLPGTSLYEDVPWITPAGSHDSYVHGNVNEVGHYKFQSQVTRKLAIRADTSIRNLPLLCYYAATTFGLNLAIMNEDFKDICTGEFWNIYPDVHGCGYVSTLQGVLAPIVREYHCDEARQVSQRN